MEKTSIYFYHIVHFWHSATGKRAGVTFISKKSNYRFCKILYLEIIMRYCRLCTVAQFDHFLMCSLNWRIPESTMSFAPKQLFAEFVKLYEIQKKREAHFFHKALIFSFCDKMGTWLEFCKILAIKRQYARNCIRDKLAVSVPVTPFMYKHDTSENKISHWNVPYNPVVIFLKKKERYSFFLIFKVKLFRCFVINLCSFHFL